ncbi:DivIVA domain-containing protein (plasmid) [Rossellomorea sp. AcN35-11]|nr:DivIVA domain-containing protein [Rossellomorea aquimaris]WJV31787.1 DivIVA domain-containing protein [Rossellomorea sp. AcN35-11]
MGLMPVDIYNKEFSKSFKGYNVDEVNEFLDQIIKEFELRIKEKKSLEEKLEKAEERVYNYSSIEETLNKSILIAQEASERVKLDAETEAKQIIKDAELRANRIVSEAMEEARKAHKDVDKLKNHAKVFRQRFQLLIGSQLAMLEHDDWDELQGPVSLETDGDVPKI